MAINNVKQVSVALIEMRGGILGLGIGLLHIMKVKGFWNVVENNYLSYDEVHAFDREMTEKWLSVVKLIVNAEIFRTSML